LKIVRPRIASRAIHNIWRKFPAAGLRVVFLILIQQCANALVARVRG
jgi:hypothetical protein